MEINFKESGFLDLEETFKLRNRLMHPKSHLDIEVTNAAFETSIRGVRWFDSKGVSIMDASMQNIKTQLSRK